MSSPEAKKLGVVIVLNIKDSDERLAALQWATAYSPQSNEEKAVILLVKKDVNGSNEHSEELVADVLSAGVPGDVDSILDTYRRNFGPQNVSGIPYKGPDIQTMLQGAIEEFKLDTLVLGMAALSKTTGNEKRIDLLLCSECTVVLVKKDPNPQKLKMMSVDETFVRNKQKKEKDQTDEKKKNKGIRLGNE